MAIRKTALPIVLAGTWITISEFARNELLFKSYWVEHYKSLNLQFQTLPLNGILWMAWSFILAFVIYELVQRFSFVKTLLIAWLSSFLMMWITAYNLQVLPLSLLVAAVPLSLIEVAVAELIIYKCRVGKWTG